MRKSDPTSTPTTVAATACPRDRPSTTGKVPRMTVAKVLAPPNWMRNRSSGPECRCSGGIVSMPCCSTSVTLGCRTASVRCGSGGWVPMLSMKVTRLVDLSVPLGPGTVVYPGDPEPRLTVHSTIERDGFNLLSVAIGSQTGTHVDAPYHFDDSTPRIDEVP